MLKFWKRRQPEVAAETIKIEFELLPDHNILVRSAWPAPHSDEESLEVATGYAVLASLINRGQLLSTIQQSVVNQADHVGDPALGRLILHTMNRSNQIPGGGEDAVRPTQVFRNVEEIGNGD